jgi:hypothetical protein
MDLEALRQNRKDYTAQLKPERRPIGILFMLLTLHLCLEFRVFHWARGYWSYAG